MAGALFDDNDDDVIAAINVVPFVDIVLVLLVIFMLTSSAIVRASISVELPTAASAGQVVASTVNVVLRADQTLYLNGQETDIESLGAYVADASWRDDKLQAVISADHRVDYGAVMEIIDVIKSNGIKAFALNIERVM